MLSPLLNPPPRRGGLDSVVKFIHSFQHQCREERSNNVLAPLLRINQMSSSFYQPIPIFPLIHLIKNLDSPVCRQAGIGTNSLFDVFEIANIIMNLQQARTHDSPLTIHDYSVRSAFTGFAIAAFTD